MNRLSCLMLISFIIIVYDLHPSFAEYCDKTESTVEYRPSYYLQYKLEKYNCGWWFLKSWGWIKCTRQVSYKASEIITYTRYYTKRVCCNGYGGYDCREPQCSHGCYNGGTCISPDNCRCAPGWTGSNCSQDIDECDLNDGECEHICHNTAGSYYCSCHDGYFLQNDTFNCTDIDECLTDYGGCTHKKCNNTIGSYQCSCWNGYELSNDNHTCIDIEECKIGAHNCSQQCKELAGRFECSCYPGYQLQTDKITCEDVDECAEFNGGCQHNCNNTNGSYSCSCTKGYKLTEDGHNCTKLTLCEKLSCLLIIKAVILLVILPAAGISAIIIITVMHCKKKRKVKQPLYDKLDEKGTEYIQMTTTKYSNGWKYKKVEDAESDSSDGTPTDEHKKMLTD